MSVAVDEVVVSAKTQGAFLPLLQGRLCAGGALEAHVPRGVPLRAEAGVHIR